MIKNYSIRQKQKLTTKYFADKAFGPKWIPRIGLNKVLKQ